MSDDRLFELLSLDATHGLSDAEERELESLLAQNPDVSRDDFALAAAAFDLALLEEPDQELPASIRKSLASTGGAGIVLFGQPASSRVSSNRPPSRAHWFPIGLAAAAVALVALGTMLWSEKRDPMQQLMANAPDVVRATWTIVDAAKLMYPDVSGEVVWSDARQAGYMRFRNLPVNDPSKSQYQLWIVDSKRDKHPVDGGVFDANADGEILIPIDSKLRVDAPAAFVITREQPGGVVVSAGPHLLIAAPAKG